SFDIGAGASLFFTTFGINYYLESGTTFEGTGKVFVNNAGTLTVDVPVTINNPFELAAGTLRGNGPLTASSSFVWSGGMLSGNLDVGPAATMTITGTLSMIMKGNLNNYGTIIWSAPGELGVSSRSVIVNHAGAVFDFRNDQLLDFHEDDGYAPWPFINEGIVVKSAGTGTSTINPYTLFVNTGTLQVLTGTLFFDGDYFTPLDGTTLTGGTYLLSGTLKLQNADIRTNAAAIVLDGPNAQIIDKTGANALA